MDDDLWTDILQAFEQEAGERPASKPEGWELCLLARVAANRLESTKSVRKTLAKRIERLLLAAEPRLDGCRGVLARGLGNAIELSAPIQEARRLVSRSLTSRSRSPRRESLRQAHTLLEKAGSAWKNQPDAVEVAANLLSAGEALSLEDGGDPQELAEEVAAPATLGPPAFFPVGNAAGRFEALTDGLCPEGELRLLFIGASDPRHLLKALLPLHLSLMKSVVMCADSLQARPFLCFFPTH
ncbi:unnamed protein product [Symbiodinium necroappetens]|uniref:Uncharacterized protein n=1 Tax=Symbiodinium necroappetens TaxID=1628268 RepID=A0A812JM76_9DINO|nr:unnamed protein product [Symbiodinium necroappetens]